MTQSDILDNLVEDFISNQTNERFADLIEKLIESDIIMLNNPDVGEGLKKLSDGAITPLVITDRDGKNYIPIFTQDKQIISDKVKKMDRITYVFKDICNDSVIENDYIEGYVLNPFTAGLKLPKEVIRIVMNYVSEQIS